MKKIAYYTGFFGADDNWTCIIPPIFSTVEDCYYFTNNCSIYDRLADTKWIRIFVNTPIKTDYAGSAMDSKELKICPNRYEVLRPYEYTCWLDSTIFIFESMVNRVIEILQATDSDMAMVKHPDYKKYKSVWFEYEMAMTLAKHQEIGHMYKKYIEKKLLEGYTDKISSYFYCTTFILRKNCERNSQMNESWLKNVYDCGIQCQIVFHFIQQEWNPLIFPSEYYSCFYYNDYYKPPIMFTGKPPKE
jgi:hypothetical protein